MANENSFLIETRPLFSAEMKEMHDWLDKNYVTYMYVGHRFYQIEGEADATILKLFWG